MRRAHVTTGVVALLVATSGLAAPATAADARVIQLAIQAEPHMSRKEVENNFRVARDNTADFNFGSISVDPIDPASFVLLSSIVRRGILDGLDSDGSTSDLPGVLVEPLRGQDGAWWIDLRSPDKFIDKAAITVMDVDSGKKRTLDDLVPASRSEVAKPLRYHSPGSYVLKLEKGLYPLGGVLTVSMEADGGREPRTENVTLPFPDVGRCYLVTLTDVKGEEQKLFRSLKDPAKVGNAIKEIYPQAATLIVGTYKYLDVEWERNSVTVASMVPANARPRRLWLRFALTEAEEAETRAELDAQLAEEEGFKKLPAWLAGRKLAAGSLLKPGDDAWIEIPVEPGGRTFEIKVPIETRAWQDKLAASPDRVGDRAILVWEFQNPTDAADRSVIKIGGEWYQRERFGWWLTGLPKAPAP